ncbi:GSCOCG00012165001-RA-CDS, partial [Cotesia congregata]
QVSWVRHRDIHLLTVGRYTYTSDQRFEAQHYPHTEEWTLKIRYPQRKDSGFYECQISTTPPIGHPVYLTIVEPVTIIVGQPDLYVNKGSTINLTCLVKYAPDPPPTMIWRHDSEVS